MLKFEILMTKFRNILSTWVMMLMRKVVIVYYTETSRGSNVLLLVSHTVLSIGSCINELYQSKETELLKCCDALSECVCAFDIF